MTKKTLFAYTDADCRYPSYVNISQRSASAVTVTVREIYGNGVDAPGTTVSAEVPLKEMQNLSDGCHTFAELYDHRVMLFLALMAFADADGLDCGWSRKHSDGKLCFGGGWVIGWITTPDGKQVRYHMADTFPLPAHLEYPLGTAWNGKEETLEALGELVRHYGTKK